MFYIMEHNLHPCSIVITLESTIYQKRHHMTEDISNCQLSLHYLQSRWNYGQRFSPVKTYLGQALDALTNAKMGEYHPNLAKSSEAAEGNTSVLTLWEVTGCD